VINLLAVCNNRSFGIWGKNVLKALNYLGADYSFFPLHPIQLEQDETDLHVPIQNGINRASMFDPNGDSITIWHAWDLAKQVGKRRIAWTLWELDRLNELEKHHLNSQDLIVVPTKWHTEIANECRIRPPVHTCPLAVDTSKFYPIKQTNHPTSSFGAVEIANRSIKSLDKTIFLSVGKWENRKGHNLLPQIFSKAFGPKDQVELWCSHNNPFLTPEEIKSWENLYVKQGFGFGEGIPAHQVKFINKWLSDKDLNILYNQADVGICLSRSEGFGLPNLEMLACGLPLIATNYAAHTEYLNDQNAHLVNITKTELARDGKWFTQGEGRWAHIGPDQEEQAIVHLRALHKKKQEMGVLTNEAGLATAHSLTWLNSAQKLMEILDA